MAEETIAAIATPLGEGGLAVIRISGLRALSIADSIFLPAGTQKKPLETASHTVLYGTIMDRSGPVDEVLLTVLRAPRTFTREDVVEIGCHGGLLVAKRVLDAVLAGGARLAMPGEFTRRAFLNGRIDLTQAEAVADLIHARTGLALKAAGEQLAGKLSQKIELVRTDLMNVLAHVEAHIDFPDEDIAPDKLEVLQARLASAMATMTHLLSTANEGRVLRQGIRAVIVGRPNAGKSSLLNQLLGLDRAIVSEIPGTTRDTIEETADVRGVPVMFVDTAGLRESVDPLEREGIRRSHESVDRAEMILHVVDGSQPVLPEDLAFLKSCGTRCRIVVLNKKDLGVRCSLPADVAAGEVVEISSLNGDGLDALKDLIRIKALGSAIPNEMVEVMINSRHQDALRRSLEGTSRGLRALKEGLTLELIAVDLRIAVNAVGEIVGKTATEDLLDTIFSTFCIGK